MNVREVEIMVEFGGGPNLSGFDPAVVRGRTIDEIGSLAILEEEDKVLKKDRLVIFDGKMIMSLTILDQVVGQFSLGQ